MGENSIFANPDKFWCRGYSELIEVSFTLKETQQNPASKIFSIFEFVKYIDCHD